MDTKPRSVALSQESELSRSMLKNSLVLAVFAAVTVAVVAITQQTTKGRIAMAEREAQIRALGEILPAHSYDNAFSTMLFT